MMFKEAKRMQWRSMMVRTPLTRDAIEAGVLNHLLMIPGLPFRVLTELELDASLETTLSAHPTGFDEGDVWIFAYGSLIWNPTFEYDLWSTGTVYGWHRCFCVGAPFGRGTLERPGLVLGLDRGGSCRGVAYRIAARQVSRELGIIWRREMVVDCYEARWVRVVMKHSTKFAITFVMKRSASNYERSICEERLIERLVSAVGELGSNAEYLFETVAGLRLAQIPDPYLERVATAVRTQLTI